MVNEIAGEENQSWFEDVDWDDLAEAFIGSLAAGVVLIIILRVLSGRRRRWRIA